MKVSTGSVSVASWTRTKVRPQTAVAPTSASSPRRASDNADLGAHARERALAAPRALRVTGPAAVAKEVHVHFKALAGAQQLEQVVVELLEAGARPEEPEPRAHA